MSVRRVLWVLTALYWAVLFTLTHLPPNHVPHAPGGDKLHHFSAYLVLTFMLGATLWQAFPSRRRMIPLLVLAAVALYGGFDEVTQIIVGRDCELNDWLADVSGGAVAGAALYVLQIYVSRRSRSRAEPPSPDGTLVIESA